MKKIKMKIIIAFITAVFATTCTVMNVSATITPPSSYDVNHDGRINISDVVYINNVLCGSHTTYDISAYDVNSNGIVDSLDSFSILAYVSEYGLTTISFNREI